jgi:hypothetical protein
LVGCTRQLGMLLLVGCTSQLGMVSLVGCTPEPGVLLYDCLRPKGGEQDDCDRKTVIMTPPYGMRPSGRTHVANRVHPSPERTARKPIVPLFGYKYGFLPLIGYKFCLRVLPLFSNKRVNASVHRASARSTFQFRAGTWPKPTYANRYAHNESEYASIYAHDGPKYAKYIQVMSKDIEMRIHIMSREMRVYMPVTQGAGKIMQQPLCNDTPGRLTPLM